MGDNFSKDMSNIKRVLKHFLRPFAHFMRRVTKALMKDALLEIDQKMEYWTWERYQQTDRSTAKWVREATEQLRRELSVSHPSSSICRDNLSATDGFLIHVGILFQIPSAWASLESVWDALVKDSRFCATLYLYDAVQSEKAQMAGARCFLEENALPYKVIDQYTLLQDRPHVLLYQTPWDEFHRPRWLQSDVVSQLGIRIAYIPYGLNYSASVWKEYIFSDLKLLAYPWRVFTFSDRMRFDHICLSPRGGANIVSVGHPKFDALAHKDLYLLPESVSARIDGRTIVFVQIHFPGADGNPSIPEADIHSYIEFLSHAEEYPSLFFVVRPHPKTVEYYQMHGMPSESDALVKVLSEKENIYWDQSPDYRPALFSADYVIGDRSALLIEAASLGIPVLYMTNYYYKEEMLPAVAPLFESYYQGSFSYDIKHFLDLVVLKGLDYKKAERDNAVRECLPPADGHSGERIVNYIAETVYAEEATNGC